jgi:hypothetical protein
MSTNGGGPAGDPALLHALVDDAAIFPPGNAPMQAAVAAHREHAISWYADLVGPFLCSDQRLPELQEALAGTDEPLGVGLVVTGGAGAIEPALRWAAGEPQIHLRGLEVALRSTDDLAAGARRIASVFAAALPDGVPRLRGDAPARYCPAERRLARRAGRAGGGGLSSEVPHGWA